MTLQKLQRDKRIGILLVNVGSPGALTVSAIRRYLRAFLGDRRVVELPRLLWLPLLYGGVSLIRPYKIISTYKTVWTDAGSPLLVTAQKQAEGLLHLLSERGFPACRVAYGMTYGRPSLQEKLSLFIDERVDEVLILPLFPQYSSATTGAVFDAVAKTLMKERVIPKIHFWNGYHREPAYIRTLTSSIEQYWCSYGRGECLIFSFHGLPKRSCECGDPYFDECHETVGLVSQALGLDKKHYKIAFQSRFGKARWLEPNLLDVLKDCASSPLTRVDVVCPGFAVDCLETLEEVNIRARAYFQRRGGLAFHYIPALNDSPETIEMMFQLVKSSLT